jgi:hypothetical protein
VSIPASPFFTCENYHHPPAQHSYANPLTSSSTSTSYYAPYARFAFCKTDATLHEAVRRLSTSSTVLNNIYLQTK